MPRRRGRAEARAELEQVTLQLGFNYYGIATALVRVAEQQ
jgi:hypothetical protein